MKKRIFYLLVLFLLVLSACGRRSAVVYRASSETRQEETAEETDRKNEETEEKAESEGTEETAEKTEEISAVTEEKTTSVYVDISGAVEHPGVYQMAAGSRIFHVITVAGGFTGQAETRCVNQADLLYDGEMIYIYTREEAEQLGGWMQLNGVGAESISRSTGMGTPAQGGTAVTSDGRVNLNLADKAELMTLSGVGEARADAIIAYRESHGAFSSIEDIMLVSGIKEKMFEQIRDHITV